MINKRLIFTALLLFNLHTPQLQTGPGCSNLTSVVNSQSADDTNQTQQQIVSTHHPVIASRPAVETQITPEKPLVRKRSELGFYQHINEAQRAMHLMLMVEVLVAGISYYDMSCNTHRNIRRNTRCNVREVMEELGRSGGGEEEDFGEDS